MTGLNFSVPDSKRLRELDFLRGVAILLVLFRHHLFLIFLNTMGWIGVDLFFVLSGFLVSGLLFKEYLKFGNIKPGLFLIRRAFKIYPVYYLFIAVYVLFQTLDHSFSMKLMWEDVFFVQNYCNGWGGTFSASWSLAVEEHFYFLLAILLSFYVNYQKGNLHAEGKRTSKIEIVIYIIMLLCLSIRVYDNFYFPGILAKNWTMTHHRIDSLAAGVLVAYWFYFKRERLQFLYEKMKFIALPVAFALLAFSPFIDPLPSFFVKTVGHSLLWMSFSIFLICFLVTENINEKLNRIMGEFTVTIVSKIGVYSYSIYIVHTLINSLVYKFYSGNHYIGFTIYFLASILFGILVSLFIENYFLRLRNIYFRARTEKIIPVAEPQKLLPNFYQ